MIAGQYLDLVLAADDRAAEAGARHVALLKSARYTVTRPLLLGAALAPSDDGTRVAAALHSYGDAVGMAFQMRDDVLGLFGDSAVTGKSALDDLREGKRTLLVLRALRLADDAQRQVLRSSLGDPDLDEGQRRRGPSHRRSHRRAGLDRGVDRRPARRRPGGHRRASDARSCCAHGAGRPRDLPSGMTRVAIVGAGLGGLSAACHLAGAGHDVTVLEAADVPGGRAGTLERGGFRFDTGPTVLTMPHLIDRCFEAAGVDGADLLTLRPVDPMYRACYADGTELRVRHGRAAMTEEIRLVCGDRDAEAFGRFCDWLTHPLRPRDADVHRAQLRLPGRPCRAVAAGARPHPPRWASAASRRWWAATSRTSGCGASSPSSPCTRVWPRTRRSPSTRSSPTWTPSTACSYRRAACTRCPSPSPRQRRRRARCSATAPGSIGSSSPTARRARSQGCDWLTARWCRPTP